MNQPYAFAMLVAGLVLSNVVHAHIGAHPDGGLGAGLLHPFSGLDHALAMVAVGLWAAQAGGRNLIAAPAAFVAAMALGAVIGVFGGYVPFAEAGIAVSVLVLGTLVALAVKGTWRWAAPLIAVFALFHGYAHGTEIPAFADRWAYFYGFLMATIVLHASGVMAALLLQKQAHLLRTGGVAIALTGAWLLLPG
jgi:urease accessory protein